MVWFRKIRLLGEFSSVLCRPCDGHFSLTALMKAYRCMPTIREKDHIGVKLVLRLFASVVSDYVV